jgi:ABC-type uncharacterized transport system substrate-binding protein
MERRTFLALVPGSLLAAPLAVEAQPAGKVRRIGYLSAGTSRLPFDLVFVRGLRELGWVEGQNFIIEARYLAGRQDLFPQAAAEIVGLGADVIVAWTPLAVVAAKKATSTVPIVGLSMGDPVRMGLVTSLARPGGNVTGVANLRPALTGKWLELLRGIVPGATRVAILSNPVNPDNADHVREVDVAIRSWKVEVKFFNASSPADFGRVFAEVNNWRPGGLLVTPDAMFWLHRADIVNRAAKNRLPAVYWATEYTEVGGLMSYAPSLDDMAQRGSVLVDKILRGGSPADIPVEQPTKFELIINLKTAKALGLTIPPSLLLRADQVIE